MELNVENDMNAKERLQGLEAALAERGVVDVKFFFNRVGSKLSEVTSDVADVLEAALEKRYISLDREAELPNG